VLCGTDAAGLFHGLSLDVRLTSATEVTPDIARSQAPPRLTQCDCQGMSSLLLGENLPRTSASPRVLLSAATLLGGQILSWCCTGGGWRRTAKWKACHTAADGGEGTLAKHLWQQVLFSGMPLPEFPDFVCDINFENSTKCHFGMFARLGLCGQPQSCFCPTRALHEETDAGAKSHATIESKSEMEGSECQDKKQCSSAEPVVWALPPMSSAGFAAFCCLLIEP